MSFCIAFPGLRPGLCSFAPPGLADRRPPIHGPRIAGRSHGFEGACPSNLLSTGMSRQCLPVSSDPNFRPDPRSGAVDQLHSLYQKNWSVPADQEIVVRRTNLVHRAIGHSGGSAGDLFSPLVKKGSPPGGDETFVPGGDPFPTSRPRTGPERSAREGIFRSYDTSPTQRSPTFYARRNNVEDSPAPGTIAA
jgi:hypothetical protein